VASVADVFRVLAQMRDEGVVTDYAIGGATAVLFYAEPTRTYDVDVFALLPSVGQSLLVSLAPVYRWAESQGFTVDAEHVLVHSVPVQILPAYNALVSAGRSPPGLTEEALSDPPAGRLLPSPGATALASKKRISLRGS
jgi:hypothetical protein